MTQFTGVVRVATTSGECKKVACWWGKHSCVLANVQLGRGIRHLCNRYTKLRTGNISAFAKCNCLCHFICSLNHVHTCSFVSFRCDVFSIRLIDLCSSISLHLLKFTPETLPVIHAHFFRWWLGPLGRQQGSLDQFYLNSRIKCSTKIFTEK